MPDNTLYYGDNLEILRRYVADESVECPPLRPPSQSLKKAKPRSGVASHPDS